MRNVSKSTLTYHATLIERTLDTAMRGERSSQTAGSCWGGEERKKEMETQGGCALFCFVFLEPWMHCRKWNKKWHSTQTASKKHKVMRGYTIFISCNLRGITTVPPRGSYWSRWAPGERRRSKLEDALFGLHSCLTAEGWNCRSHFSHQTWEPEKQIESVLAARYISSIQSSATTLKPLADNSMKDTDQRCSTTFQRKTLVLGIQPPRIWFDSKYRLLFWSTVSTVA